MSNSSRHIPLITAIVLLALFITFMIQNAAVVSIHFLFWSFSISRSLLIIMVLVIGMLIGWLLTGYYQRHHRKKRSPL